MSEKEQSEKAQQSAAEKGELEQVAHEGRERKAEQLERKSPERGGEKSNEKTKEARNEAREAAAKQEKQAARTQEKQPTLEKRNKAPSKTERKTAYNTVMREAQQHMSGPSRSFSKAIHNPVVEKVSDVAGSTVARPNAILAGSMSAFILTLGTFLIARYFGYPLSGAETIVAFILGWALGLLFDYFKAMITGKPA